MPKITNKLNLPSAFVNLAHDLRNPVEKQYSATTLLRNTREIILERRHWDEIEMDVADMVWLIFGTATHKILEEADQSGYAEYELETEVVDGYKLTGICDLYNEKLFAVEDYKTCSVYKVIKKDFEDWKKQGLIYAYLLRLQGKIVNKLRFHALMKDWTPGEKKLATFRNQFYPDFAIWTWEYEITEADIMDIKIFIKKRFEELMIAETLEDKDLPLCTQEERWNSGDKYAVYLNPKAARASKVFTTMAEAQLFKAENNKPDAKIEIRKGEDKKCLHYCKCCKFCDYYKNHVEGKQ